MNIVFNLFSNQTAFLFKERLTIALTDQQKRIAIISGLAMSALALCYVLHRCCFKARPVSHSPGSQPVSPFTKKKQTGYEWVVGEKNAKQFLESEKDLSIVAAVAKDTVSYRSPLMDSDLCLYIGDLVRYASLEQIKAIVNAVVDDNNKLRAIFFFLFWVMNNDPSHIGVWKQKAKVALQSLSHKQLMDILDIKKTDDLYQFTEQEIYFIPVSGFLKWQVDLNLPQDFIKACTELDEYAKFVKLEADKERAQGIIVAFD